MLSISITDNSLARGSINAGCEGIGNTNVKKPWNAKSIPAAIMIFMMMNAIAARMKLLIGPAAETLMFAFLLSRHISGFVCTGFAQPRSGKPVTNPMIGNNIVPNGSICAIGFSVIRP